MPQLNNDRFKAKIKMEVILIWLTLTVIVGVAASRRFNRSFFNWAVISFLILPVLAFLLLWAMGKPKPAQAA